MHRDVGSVPRLDAVARRVKPDAYDSASGVL